MYLKRKYKKSEITPNPSGHRPQCPCALRRTWLAGASRLWNVQQEAQGAAPGQTKDQTGGRATANGRTTKQEGEGWPTPTQAEAASCTPQKTHQARTLRLETRIATSCAKGKGLYIADKEVLLGLSLNRPGILITNLTARPTPKTSRKSASVRWV